ncbi:MAG: type secretion system protein [Dehalococcoidia bacterium]|nr:type secretion system protein [Dehalococcoidia bacterium]
MAIDYIAYNSAGDRVAGVVEVDSVEEAEQRLWSSGLLVVQLRRRVEREGSSLLVRLFPTFFGVTFKDVVTATRQMETLLRAGVSLPIALRQLRDQTRSPGFKATLGDILAHVEAGERFSTACARHPRVFPPFYLRLLPLAEETGDLPTILNGILHTMERQQSVGSKVKGALVTPAISMVVAFIAGAILITFVLPRLVAMLGEFGGRLPASTRLLLSISDFGQTYGVYTFAALAVALLLANMYFTRTLQGIRVKDRFMLKAPVLSSIVQASAMFGVCSSLSLLLRAGVPPVAALRSVTTMVGNRIIQEALTRVEAQVTQGMRLGEACQRERDLPLLFANAIANGEQAGSLRQNLEALADYYQTETERVVSMGTTLIQPVLILLISGVVGFIAVSIVSAIYSVITPISETI